METLGNHQDPKEAGFQQSELFFGHSFGFKVSSCGRLEGRNYRNPLPLLYEVVVWSLGSIHTASNIKPPGPYMYHFNCDFAPVVRKVCLRFSSPMVQETVPARPHVDAQLLARSDEFCGYGAKQWSLTAFGLDGSALHEPSTSFCGHNPRRLGRSGLAGDIEKCMQGLCLRTPASMNSCSEGVVADEAFHRPRNARK